MTLVGLAQYLLWSGDMRKSEYAIGKTLEHEGGWVDDPADPGGATNFGISLRWYKDAISADATPADIQALTKDEAIALYHQKFWLKVYDQILDKDVAQYIFDMHVNHGQRQAHLMTQRAVRATGQAITEDGVIGPNTIKKINKVSEHTMLAALKATRAGFYRELIGRKPAMQKFLGGWLRRAYA